MNMFRRNETRPAPPSGRPPAYIFARYYRYSLRPVVIGIGIAAALWSLLWGASSFRNIDGDKRHNLGKLVVFDIVLGALYMAVAAIELYGIWGSIKQSLALIRVYAFLSLVALGITTASEILRIVVHFAFKGSLIGECSKILQADGFITTDFGFMGSHRAQNLTAAQADEFCRNAWSKDTFSDFAWLFAAIIFGLLFSSIAFSYYRQLLDPSSLQNNYPRSDAVPLNTFNGPYAQNNFYNNPYPPPEGRFGPPGFPPPGPGYSGAPDYAPPYDNTKLPGYAGETRKSNEEEKK